MTSEEREQRILEHMQHEDSLFEDIAKHTPHLNQLEFISNGLKWMVRVGIGMIVTVASAAFYFGVQWQTLDDRIIHGETSLGELATELSRLRETLEKSSVDIPLARAEIIRIIEWQTRHMNKHDKDHLLKSHD